MTDKEAIINEFLEYYNHKIPDPIHYPKQFEYYLKLFYYYRNSKPDSEN